MFMIAAPPSLAVTPLTLIARLVRFLLLAGRMPWDKSPFRLALLPPNRPPPPLPNVLAAGSRPAPGHFCITLWIFGTCDARPAFFLGPSTLLPPLPPFLAHAAFRRCGAGEVPVRPR